jgi:hypothetical protein
MKHQHSINNISGDRGIVNTAFRIKTITIRPKAVTMIVESLA